MKCAKKYFLLFALMIAATHTSLAQAKGVVADESTHLPIAHVNIYASNAGSVRATTSDENGAFEVDFGFQNLTFSHINYRKVIVEKSSMSDTIFLAPTSITLPEIVVTNVRLDWIEKKLKEFVRQKKKNYRTVAKNFSYHYHTYTLSDSSGYAFQSSGILHMPSLAQSERYAIDAQKNIISYKDKIAGADFSSLQRILYDDFMVKFDSKFIKSNDFSQNKFFEGEGSLVQLLFTNKKCNDVSGYLILDTFNNVVVEAELNSGTDYNLKNQTDGVLRSVAKSRGFSYGILEIKKGYAYKKSGSSYYLSESRYKLTQKTAFENKKRGWTYFNAAEAQLLVGNEVQADVGKMLALPEHWYIKAIYTKRMQQEDAALQSVPKTFEPF